MSSRALAEASGVNSAKVRKDLSYLGSYGVRGVGYDVAYLRVQIARELGLSQHWATCIVGLGNLGLALAHYGGFSERGFRLAALFDDDPAKVGQRIAGVCVEPVADCARIVAARGIAIGVVAVPAAAAQPVVDTLCAAGISSILNFAPTVLEVDDGVLLRNVDLSTELQILAFYEQRKAAQATVELAHADDAGEAAQG